MTNDYHLLKYSLCKKGKMICQFEGLFPYWPFLLNLYNNKRKVGSVFGMVMYRFGRAIARWNRYAIQMIMS